MRKQMCLNTKACIYVSVNNYMTIVYLPDLDKTYLFLTVSLNSAKTEHFHGYICVCIACLSLGTEEEFNQSYLLVYAQYMWKKTALFIKLSSFKPIFLSIIFSGQPVLTSTSYKTALGWIRVACKTHFLCPLLSDSKQIFEKICSNL